MIYAQILYTLLGFDILSLTHTHILSLSLSLASEMARIQAVVWVLVLAVLLLLSPCSARRELHGRRLSPSVRRSLNSGDDSASSTVKVADYQSQYNEWVRFQTEALNDYPPAAANPGGPYTTP